MQQQLETWKKDKTSLLIVFQEGDFTYSIRGYIKDCSEEVLVFQTENGQVQILNRKFIIKIREITKN